MDLPTTPHPDGGLSRRWSKGRHTQALGQAFFQVEAVKKSTDGWVFRLLSAIGFQSKTFIQAFYMAVLATGGALTLHTLARFGYADWFKYGGPSVIEMNSAVWNGVSFLLGFLVVFRASQSYNRYWQALTSVHLMRAEWFDACSALCAFTRRSKCSEDDVFLFKQRCIRLFSLFHSACLLRLMSSGRHQDNAFNLNLLDPCFDEDTIYTFQTSKHKVEVIYQWIQHLIVDSQDAGIIAVPPPILSRCFQEMANGMVKYHDALKVKTIPFPIAYAQVCDRLLYIHWVLTPFVVCIWVNSRFMASLITFITIFIFWSVVAVSKNIENPFRSSRFVFEAVHMQDDLNATLAILTDPAADCVPSLPGLSQEHIEGVYTNTLGSLWQLGASKIDVDTSEENRVIAFVGKSNSLGKCTSSASTNSKKTGSTDTSRADTEVAEEQKPPPISTQTVTPAEASPKPKTESSREAQETQNAGPVVPNAGQASQLRTLTTNLPVPLRLCMIDDSGAGISSQLAISGVNQGSGGEKSLVAGLQPVVLCPRDASSFSQVMPSGSTSQPLQLCLMASALPISAPKTSL